MNRLRLYVVIDVEDDALLEDLPASVAEVLDGTVGDPCFVGMSEGYAGEFAEPERYYRAVYEGEYG